MFVQKFIEAVCKLEVIDPVVAVDVATSRCPQLFLSLFVFLRGLEVGTEAALISMDKPVTETGCLCLCRKTGKLSF